MSVLVVNAGSTSVKYKLFHGDAAERVAGMIEAANGCVVSSVRTVDGERSRKIETGEEYNAAALILEEVGERGVERIGFRVVHGGESFTEPVRITAAVVDKLDELSRLAPLHNPPALDRIREFRALLPDTRQYAVFDTAFHSTLAPEAYLYSIPYELYENHRIRKYGFHGISHQYVSSRLAELEGGAARGIICHLGGGASITAVRNGRSVETSMGFTPLAGLTMATRSGDLDVGVVFHLMDHLGLSPAQARDMLNRKSGLLGLSGWSADMRCLLDRELAGDEQSARAVAVYVHHIRRYIGAYAAVLGGVDVLAFTAGVGAGSAAIRRRACSSLGYLGIEIDDPANEAACAGTGERRISTTDSVPVWVVPTDEELQIYRAILRLKC